MAQRNGVPFEPGGGGGVDLGDLLERGYGCVKRRLESEEGRDHLGDVGREVGLAARDQRPEARGQVVVDDRVESCPQVGRARRGLLGDFDPVALECGRRAPDRLAAGGADRLQAVLLED